MNSSSRDAQAEAAAVIAMVRTADILNRYLDVWLQQRGLSLIRFAVMNALYVHGRSMKPTAISKWVFRARHTITSVLDFLERDKLVRREPDPKDRRSVNIIMTEKGVGVENELRPAVEKTSQEILSCLDDEEVEALNSILRKLRRHMLSQMSKNSKFDLP